MGTIEQIIIDTLDGGIAPIELVIQSEIERERGESDRMDRVTIPAPPPAVDEMEMI